MNIDNTTDPAPFSRYTESFAENDTDEAANIKSEHMDRLRLGKDAWNAWSEDFRKWIEENGIEDAVIDISGIAIEHKDFVGYVFTAYTDFRNAWFIGNPNFRGAQHTDYETFAEAQLEEGVDLMGAEFI